MRVKELQKTVNVAWSPIQQTPILLAAGTAAGQLDTSFSTESVIELYDINLSNPGADMILMGKQSSPKRFHKIIWSPAGFGGRHQNGLIVGGCDGGNLQIYSAAKLLAGEEALIIQQEKHTGPVRSLDYNPFQSNLLASAATESEILIWDLNNTTTPMTPGTKTQPLEDVLAVSWNRQVQHILASVFASRCVIWDLRKNEPIIKLSDSQTRVRWRTLQWHPEVATQLWLASEDDQNPVVQLWDLRYATAPAKSLEIHTRGVLGLSYCPSDSELMVSCGKDFKIFCWNPKSELPGGEILSEIATSNQWYSDITWCPKNPALIASTSVDGVVSLYSLFGGDQKQQLAEANCKLADSFPGMDKLSEIPVNQQQQQQQQAASADLKKPPKWLKRPIGAYFGFGGKLITFSNQTPKNVCITQVITEPELIEKTNRLEEILNQTNLSEYCREKADQTDDKYNRLMWYFLKSNFELNPREEMLNLLGFDKNDVSSKFNSIMKKQNNTQIDHLSDNLNDLNCNQNNENIFESIATDYKESAKILKKRQRTYSLKSGSDSDSIITEAILTGNLEAAVDLCFEHGHKAEAIIIANAGGPELLEKTQNYYLTNNENYLSNVISALITNDWSTVMAQCSMDSWKEALVAALTHSQEELPILCEKLGERLQNESNNDIKQLRNAVLCYICAGSVEKLINVWEKKQQQLENDTTETINLKTNISQLQELVEIVMLLQKGIEGQGRSVEITGSVANLMESYSNYLVGQGNLNSALIYLGQSKDQRLIDLRERIYYSLGYKQAYTSNLSQQSNQPRPSMNNHFGQQQPTPFSGSQIQKTPLFHPNAQSPVPSWNLQQNVGYNSSAIPAVNAPPLPLVPNPSVMGPPPTSQVTDQITSLQQQPPRPSSVGSQHGGLPPASAIHRSKYVLDPSVGQNQMGGSYYAPNSNNQMFSGSANMSGYSQSPLMPSTLNSASQHQQSNIYSQPTNNFTTNFNNQPIATNMGIDNYNNTTSGGMYTEQQPPPPPSMLSREINPGWNDPPALKTARAQDFNQNNPITHPIYGQEINQNIPQQQQPTLYGQQQQPQQQQQQQLPPPPPPQMFGQPQLQQQMPKNDFSNYNQTEQLNQFSVPPPPPSTDFQSNFNLQSTIPAQQQQQQQQQQQSSQPIQRKQSVETIKRPIPTEYLHIQKTFESLRIACIQASSNPQSKRKLEDVAKRLECLYDFLRESRLTPNTLQSLIELEKLIISGDYTNSISLHTQMVSGADFSQIASFMPGIKVLLQSAIQMQVYLK